MHPIISKEATLRQRLEAVCVDRVVVQRQLDFDVGGATIATGLSDMIPDVQQRC